MKRVLSLPLLSATLIFTLLTAACKKEDDAKVEAIPLNGLWRINTLMMHYDLRIDGDSVFEYEYINSVLTMSKGVILLILIVCIPVLIPANIFGWNSIRSIRIKVTWTVSISYREIASSSTHGAAEIIAHFTGFTDFLSRSF